MSVHNGTDFVPHRNYRRTRGCHDDTVGSLTARLSARIVVYAVTARPAFDVPGFILKRLLTRDSRQMIQGLRREITAQAARTLPEAVQIPRGSL